MIEIMTTIGVIAFGGVVGYLIFWHLIRPILERLFP